MAHIFITGGTGFIGMNILNQLTQENHRITALVRSQQRFDSIIEKMGLKDTRSITPVIGDLTQSSLGLNPTDYERVLTADIIIHSGGPMDILLEEHVARKVFVEAADQIIALANHIHKNKQLKHFIHIVGYKSPINENNMAFPERITSLLEHESPYEQMKFIADLHIRQEAKQSGFPLSVIHPSVVIGDSITGITEQLGGLGILVNSTRRNLMRIVPGGKKHWLPLVHVDHVASFVSALSKEDLPTSQTYYLLEQQNKSLNMMQLMNNITKELRVPKPIGSISPVILSTLLNSRLGKKLQIPGESLTFIVNQPFPVQSTEQIQQQYQLDSRIDLSVFPHVISDLDFRLTHTQSKIEHPGYRRNKRGPLATLERSGNGDPIVILPGTFSGADCLIPLADALQDHSVWLVDLPGFGRSPYHHASNVMEGHVNAIVEAISNHPTPVTLIGHSYGGLLAAKVMEQIPERIHAAHLLQPVLHPAAWFYKSPILTETILSRLTESAFRKMLVAQHCFETPDHIPQDYITFIMEELRSPRVKKTLAETLSALTRKENYKLNPEIWANPKVTMMWGTQDHKYHVPSHYHHINIQQVPYGHHFPISHPEQTAYLLRTMIKE